MSLTQHIEGLNHFAIAHLTGDPDADDLIRLKMDHSQRVLKNASQIIDQEDIDGRTGELCRLAALYHDIGRFPQFAKYRTFNDRESTNHGRLGVLTLRGLDLPGELSARDLRTIRFAVGQHNLKTIRDTLPHRVRTVTHVVRDADKLDIYKIMIDHFNSDSRNPLVTFGIDGAPDKYSDVIYQSVMNEEAGDYTQIRYANDFLLVVVGWLFDFHFQSSVALLSQRSYLDQAFSLLPNDDKIKALKDKSIAFIRYNSSVTP